MSAIDSYYNLSKILGEVNVIEEPVKWVYYYNLALDGWFIISMLALVGVALFFFVRRVGESDIRSAMYASFMTSFVGLLLFLITVPDTSLKLLSWGQLVPFFVITLVLILVDKINQEY